MSHQLKIKDTIIFTRKEDNYVNAIELCKIGNRRIDKWFRLLNAKKLIDQLEEKIGKNAISIENEQPNKLLFIHSDLVVPLAKWISLDFVKDATLWYSKLDREEEKVSNSFIREIHVSDTILSELNQDCYIKIIGWPQNPWFYAKSILKLLGYKDIGVLNYNVSNEYRKTYAEIYEFMANEQNISQVHKPLYHEGKNIYINTLGLHQLILKSKFPKAVMLKESIFDRMEEKSEDILPDAKEIIKPKKLKKVKEKNEKDVLLQTKETDEFKQPDIMLKESIFDRMEEKSEDILPDKEVIKPKKLKKVKEKNKKDVIPETKELAEFKQPESKLEEADKSDVFNAILNYIDESIRFDDFSIKIIGTPDEPWFDGKSVATLLGYKHPKIALQDHVSGKYKKSYLEIYELLGGKQNASHLNTPTYNEGKAVYINEAGLYELIFKSKLPIAVMFKEHVFEVVIPNIRKKEKEKYIKQLHASDQQLLLKDIELKKEKEYSNNIQFVAEHLISMKKRDKKHPAMYQAAAEAYRRLNMIKFGRTKNPHKRKCDQNNPIPPVDEFTYINTYETFEGMDSVTENYLKELFSPFNLRSDDRTSTEHFYMSEKLMDYVVKNTLKSQDEMIHIINTYIDMIKENNYNMSSDAIDEWISKLQ